VTPRIAAVAALVVIGAAFAGGGGSSVGREASCRGELVSPSFGWTLCDRGLFRGLFATSNGRDWKPITPPGLTGQAIDVVFLDRAHGWVVANECVGGDAFVYRTSDGGETWRHVRFSSVNCAAGSGLTLSFVDARHGWLTSTIGNSPDDPFLARSNDGGATWRGVTALPVKGRVVFRTPREGWLGRSDFRQIQRLYTSRDGGRSWERRVLNPPSGWEGARLFPDVPVFFGAHGVLPVTVTRGGSSAVAFYASNDGGRRWGLEAVRRVRLRVLRPGNPFVWYMPVSVAGPSVWWIADGGGIPSISVTANAGRSWRGSTDTKLRGRWWSISGADRRRAWFTTYAGDVERLYATKDGGRTWQRLSPR
jgi:photosystem II stability/assembly factor-like uncharacterized protein